MSRARQVRIDGAPPPAGLAGILLAAGASRRLGRPKQLVVVDGEPLVRRAAVRLLAVCSAGVVVVGGAGHGGLVRVLAGLPVRIVRAPGWPAGIGLSLRRGVRASSPAARGLLVWVADQTGVEAEDLAALAAAWAAAPDRPAAAVYAGHAGVPAIFPGALRARLVGFAGHRGARELLRGEPCTHVPMPAAAEDLDTPADLDRLAAAGRLSPGRSSR